MAVDRFTELLVFIRTIETGSFSSAGRELQLTPSAVSKLISRLELRLGVRLLNRSSRSLGLTPEGESFLEGARRAMEALEDAESRLKTLISDPSGVLRVYAPPTFAYRLAPLIAKFVVLFPKLRIDFQLGNERVDPVRSNIDIAIRIGNLADSSLVSRKIGDTGWIICAAPSYLSRHGTPRTPSDLLKHNCLNFSISTHQVVWSFLEKGSLSHLRVQGNMASNQAEMLRLLCVEGNGIVRVSDYLVEDDIAAGTIVPLLMEYHPQNPEPIWALFQHQRNLSPRIRVFIDFLHRNWRAPLRQSPTKKISSETTENLTPVSALPVGTVTRALG